MKKIFLRKVFLTCLLAIVFLSACYTTVQEESPINNINAAIGNFNELENGKVKIIYRYEGKDYNHNLLNAIIFKRTKSGMDFCFIDPGNDVRKLADAADLLVRYKKIGSELYFGDYTDEEWTNLRNTNSNKIEWFYVNDKKLRLKEIYEKDLIDKIMPNDFEFLMIPLKEKEFSSMEVTKDVSDIEKYILELKPGLWAQKLGSKAGDYDIEANNCKYSYSIKDGEIKNVNFRAEITYTNENDMNDKIVLL